MRYRHWFFALAAGFVFIGEATAQSGSPNPVTAHYRAYREALAAGNLTAAEASAAAALEASIARDGDGGNTAVLAINLAQTRLMLRRRNDAYEPAQLAYRIASAGGSSVDQLMARLVLGRTQLTPERDGDGREMLERAIQEARARPDLRAETYAAAADLGRWQLAREQYTSALDAWTIATELVDAAEGDTDYARAEARLFAAASQMARAMAGVIREQARPTDTRMNTDAYRPIREADEALAQAQALMEPYARVAADGDGLTLGQRTYATAIAWRILGRAFLQSRGQRPLPGFEATPTATVSNDPRPTCAMSIVAEPEPSFPPGASLAFAVGAVVVRFNVDEQGQTRGVDVAASVPERWFRDAVERVSPQWRVVRDPSAPADCRYPPVVYQTMRFYFR